MLLYHGSPNNLSKLEIRTPRGDNEFNSKPGVYLTSNRKEAELYAIARDKNRINRSWGIKYVNNISYLLLRSEKWSDTNPIYKLNKYGYLYVCNETDYIQNPNVETEYLIKHEVYPIEKIKINLKNISNNILYLDQEEYLKSFD